MSQAGVARTGDVWRQRALLVSALVTVVVSAAGAVAASSATGARSVGALALPHERAKVACASCHITTDAPATCGGCHDPKLHQSTRKAHRALMEKGALRCATCHPAHGDAYGVSFGGEGKGTLFHASASTSIEVPLAPAKGITVPLVRTDRCTGCHSATSAADPIARCRDSSGFSTCWEEHETPLLPRASSGVCKAQHGETRYIAWEAASRAMKSAPPAASASGQYGNVALPSSLAGVLAGAFAYVMLARRGRKRGSNVAKVPAFAAPRKKLPVINPVTCLGCYACVDACPFGVLEIKQYVAVVARPKDCTGVVLCEPACPNGSLVIHEGEATEGALRIDEHGESLDAPGLFVAGDLTGLPLIKNAIAQGARVVARIRERKKELARAADVDVAIVGAGPAGLSAALAAKEAKLSARIFEQGDLAASIRAFPRDKLVFDAPLTMPVHGPLEFQSAKKDELVRAWERIVRKHELRIESRTRVVSVTREGQGYRVITAAESGAGPGSGSAQSVLARAVVLATGKYGSPRPFEAEVTEAAASHVHRFLSDARSFEGKRVVVVGLGDSAMEAAIALSKQPGTSVTLVHRGTEFARGRKRNVDEVRHMSTRGTLELRLGTQVRRVEPGLVHLVAVGSHTADIVEADAVLVLIGGEPAWGLLSAAGLRKEENFSTPDTSTHERSNRETP